MKYHTGDEVFWNDPDNGICSKYIKILQIEYIGEVVRIMDYDGNILECFLEELE